VLRGRDDVLALLRRWLDGVGQGAGGGVHLEGSPGVGKTAIVEWTAERARDEGRRLMRVVGHPEESSIAWGGLSQLVAPHLSHLSSFDERPRNTLMRAMRLGDDGDVDDVSVGMSLLYLLTYSDESTIVLVDDAQWLDLATINALRFVSRRLQSTGVGLLTAQHPGGGLAAPDRVVVEALDVAHLRSIARDRGAASAVAEALAQQSDGLPVALMHLLDALDEEQLRGRRPLPGDFAELGHVDSVISMRLMRLPEPTRLLLAAVALAPYRTVDDLAAELAIGDLAPVLEPALTGSFIDRVEGIVRFRHPSIRTAVVRSLGAATRRTLHRVLARNADVQHAAWHLAAAAEGPDDTVAEALDELALDAEVRGASLEALRARQSAMAMAQSIRPDRVLAAARHAVAARLPEVAATLLEHLDDEPSTEVLRAEIAWISGQVGEARRRWTELAQAEVPTDIARLSVRRAAMAAFRMYDTPAVLRLTRGGSNVDHESPYVNDDPLLPVIDSGAASIGGEPGAVERLVNEVHKVLEISDDAETVAVLAEVATLALARTGRSNDLAAVSELVGDLANERSPRSVPALMIARAAYRARSDLAGAVALARDAMSLAEEWDLDEHRPFALAIAAITEATMGGPSARELADAMRAYGVPVAVAVATYAEALMQYGQGAHDRAISLLMPLHERHPTERSFGFFWHHDLVDIALRVDARPVAEQVTRDLETVFGATKSPWVKAALMRCRGLLAEDRVEAEHWFTEAIDGFTNQGYLVTAGRVHLDLGERLRRQRQRSAARTHIEAARPLLVAGSARPWARRCEEEAAALGLAPAETSTQAALLLTPRELQVARWLVSGFTFKQIGSRLFLSPRTAEAHGQTIYRKLGVRGRAELAQLAVGDPSLSPSER
jgi:DNA-binding CsgD family transcriptional regulator